MTGRIEIMETLNNCAVEMETVTNVENSELLKLDFESPVPEHYINQEPEEQPDFKTAINIIMCEYYGQEVRYITPHNDVLVSRKTAKELLESGVYVKVELPIFGQIETQDKILKTLSRRIKEVNPETWEGCNRSWISPFVYNGSGEDVTEFILQRQGRNKYHGTRKNYTKLSNYKINNDTCYGNVDLKEACFGIFEGKTGVVYYTTPRFDRQKVMFSPYEFLSAVSDCNDGRYSPMWKFFIELFSYWTRNISEWKPITFYASKIIKTVFDD